MKQDDQLDKVLRKCADRLESEVPAEDDRATLYLALGVIAALNSEGINKKSAGGEQDGKLSAV